MLLLGACGCCCALICGIKEMIAMLFKKLAKGVKKHLKDLLYKHAPNSLVDKLPWDWKVDDTHGDAQPKVEVLRAEGKPTQRQKLGLPEVEAKALKESRRDPIKRLKKEKAKKDKKAKKKAKKA